jgi:hypothetical protein
MMGWDDERWMVGDRSMEGFLECEVERVEGLVLKESLGGTGWD